MFRFTIRDLLWLTVVVALAAGWLVDQYRSYRRELKWDECVSSLGRRLAGHENQQVVVDTPYGPALFEDFATSPPPASSSPAPNPPKK